MKLFIGLSVLCVAWAIPISEENIILQELKDVIPEVDSNMFAKYEKESASYLPQFLDVAHEESSDKLELPANDAPMIEPLNGPKDVAIENLNEDDFDEVSSDETKDDDSDVVAAQFVEDYQELKALFESNSDEKSPIGEIQIVDSDTNDVKGIMEIAPSELDTIRIYFNEDMAQDLNRDEEKGPTVIRYYDDPYLR